MSHLKEGRRLLPQLRVLIVFGSLQSPLPCVTILFHLPEDTPKIPVVNLSSLESSSQQDTYSCQLFLPPFMRRVINSLSVCVLQIFLPVNILIFHFCKCVSHRNKNFIIINFIISLISFLLGPL